MFRRIVVAALPLLSMLLVANASRAGALSTPSNITADSPTEAVAASTSLTNAETTLSSDRGRIDRLERAVAALQVTVSDQQTLIDTLQTDLAAVQGNSVLALDGALELGSDVSGYATAIFSGVNVQIINGLGRTDVTNGLGNLTIGYNESVALEQIVFCSDGAFDNQPDCMNSGGVWAPDQRTGSHNLVLGFANAYSQYGGLLAGAYNVTNGPYSAVGGGYYNMASGPQSAISGGNANTASGNASSVSGGSTNTASADESSISGGLENSTIGIWSSISGGLRNSATGAWGAISGGNQNIASGNYSSVSGGQLNESSNYAASVSGGMRNTASAEYSTVGGGNERVAPGYYNWVGGSLLEDH